MKRRIGEDLIEVALQFRRQSENVGGGKARTRAIGGGIFLRQRRQAWVNFHPGHSQARNPRRKAQAGGAAPCAQFQRAFSAHGRHGGR